MVKTEDEKREMAQKHRFRKEREFKRRLDEHEENEEGDIRSFKFHKYDLGRFDTKRRRDNADDDNREGRKEKKNDRRNDWKADRRNDRKGDRKGGEAFGKGGKNFSKGGRNFNNYDDYDE